MQWRHRNRARRTPAWVARLDMMSPWAAAAIAALLQPWTLVAAAAVTAAQARLSGVGGYLALASFCLLVAVTAGFGAPRRCWPSSATRS